MSVEHGYEEVLVVALGSYAYSPVLSTSFLAHRLPSSSTSPVHQLWDSEGCVKHFGKAYVVW